MYIIKNAWRNVLRFKGRNILIAVIITIVTISASISLSIKNSSDDLIQSYKDKNQLAVSFSLDPMSLRDASEEEKKEFETLTIDMIKNYADSDLISDYYYNLEVSANSDDIEAVDYSELKIDEDEKPDMPDKDFKMNNGDFRITAYSDVSYLNDFVEGIKKIKEGSMVANDSDMEIVISEDLASENDLKLNDEVTFTNASNDEDSHVFKIVGIYEDTTDVNENSFGGNMMNSRNQVYTSMSSIQKYELDTDESENTKRMMSGNGLTAKFYLKDNDNLKKFEKEVRNKGLSTYYNVTTNEDEITNTLKPIKNLTNFSITFLIITLIVGGIILAVINLINIRERKYEIGVLRAIGMSKRNITFQLISETLIISIISFIVGLIGGILLSQPVTNTMLKNEINSYQTESTNIQNNFGGDNFKGNIPNRNSFKNLSTQNFVDSLDVKTNGITIIYLLLITIGLTCASSIVSVMFINKYEPNKILQNRI